MVAGLMRCWIPPKPSNGFDAPLHGRDVRIPKGTFEMFPAREELEQFESSCRRSESLGFEILQRKRIMGREKSGR